MNWCKTVVAALLVMGWDCGLLHADSSTEVEDAALTKPQATVVVVPFENKGGNPDLVHWSSVSAGRLGSRLGYLESIRLISGSTYGLRELGIEAGAPIADGEARRIGELTEARWIVYGSWEKNENEWLLEVRLLKTAGDDPARQIQARSEDWFTAIDQAAFRILENLGIELTVAERGKIETRPTKSFEAYELYALTWNPKHRNAPMKEIEAVFRKATQIDPGFLNARVPLAQCLINQGRVSEAEELVQQILAENPEKASAHLLAGQILFYVKTDTEGAEKEFQEAIRLAPDSVDAHKGLAVIYVSNDRSEDALALLLKARELSPFDSDLWALLAKTYIKLGDLEAAHTAIQEAERLNHDHFQTELRLGSIYGRLAEFSKAVAHYEKALALGRKANTAPDRLQWIEAQLQPYKERLIATPVEATRPRIFSPEALRAELAKRLTAEELDMVVVPFEITDEMKAWAREKTADARSDHERAKALFDLLVRRVRGRGKGGTRTAKELFAMWKNPEENYSCQEYAKLFVGLGRAIGLDAFYVHLEKDCKGRIVYHDCAALFLDGEAYLVDPAYWWFGAPHRQFEILDDLQTVAHHFFQPRTVEERQLAVKLHPDHAWGQLAMVRAYAKTDVELAEKHLARAAELEPNRWDWFLLRGQLTRRSEGAHAALPYLREAVALNPENPEVQIFLGIALQDLGKTEQALEAFRAAIRHDNGYHDNVIGEARKAIAHINEAQAMLEGDDSAMQAIRKRAEAGDAEAQNNLAISFTKRAEPDWAEAERWATMAIEQDYVRAHDTLGVIRIHQGRLDEAVASMRRAVALDENFAGAWRNLGAALEEQEMIEEAIHAWSRACELDPENQDLLRLLVGITARNGRFEECGYWMARLALLRSTEEDEAEIMATIARDLSKLQVVIPSKDPSDAELHSYLATHRDELGKKSVHMRSLSVRREDRTHDFMEKLRAELVAGGDFAAAAREFSDDWAADKGGDRDWEKRDDLPAHLAQAAFALDIGQLSTVLEDTTHYRILKIIELERCAELTLDAVKDQMVAAIKDKDRKETIKTWIAKASKDLGKTKK